MNHHLTLEAFVLALERYGGDPDRWPSSLREAATELIATSPEAANALGRARALERILRAHDPAADIKPLRSAVVRERVLAATWTTALEPRSVRGGWWRVFLPSEPVRLPALRFAATALTAAVLGILAGQGLSQFGTLTPEVVAPSDTQTGLAAMFRPPLAMTVAVQ